MSPRIDLTADPATPWADPATYWPGLDAATRELDAPFGVLHRGALAHNAHDLVRRAAGLPIRVASKSVRARAVLDAVLALPGFGGVLAYTVAEALWLAESGVDDVVVAYPSVDRAALARLAASDELARRVTIMIDDPAQLDVVDASAPPGSRATVRVALDLDASLDAPVLGRIGVFRSPLRESSALAQLAVHVVGRPGFRLVGVMAYEAQVAGVGDAPAGAFAIRALQRRSMTELVERRGAAVARVRDVLHASGDDLEFVNGGGTGSIHVTRLDPSVTEIAAGSGLYGPHLFDHYRAFTPAPAAAFALPVVRTPTGDVATVLGGGWIASGPPGTDRLPEPVWPAGLRYLPREGAGEVQTPVRGAAAHRLRIGDRVWLRHAKAGELAEHLQAFQLIEDDAVIDVVPTYRGEGKTFL